MLFSNMPWGGRREDPAVSGKSRAMGGAKGLWRSNQRGRYDCKPFERRVYRSLNVPAGIISLAKKEEGPAKGGGEVIKEILMGETRRELKKLTKGTMNRSADGRERVKILSN